MADATPEPRVSAKWPQGHDEPCYYCGEPTNALHGNPSLWPLPLCHADDPGVTKWHHTGCISKRLVEHASQAEALAAKEASIGQLERAIDTLDTERCDFGRRALAAEAALKVAREALEMAKRHIITLHPAHDPRALQPRDVQDQVQIAVLDEIDAALTPEEPPPPWGRCP